MLFFLAVLSFPQVKSYDFHKLMFEPTQRFLHRWMCFVSIVFSIQILWIVLGVQPHWCIVTTLLIGSCAVFFISRQNLPLQNCITLILLFGFLGCSGEFSFRPLHQSSIPPLAMAPAWCFVLLSARSITQWMLVNHRGCQNYGFWLLGITGLLAGTFISGIAAIGYDIQLTLSQFASRTLIALVILLIGTPFLISKKPGPIVLNADAKLLWNSACFGFLIVAGYKKQWGPCILMVSEWLIPFVVSKISKPPAPRE